MGPRLFVAALLIPRCGQHGGSGFSGRFGSEDTEDCVGAGFPCATGAAFWATGERSGPCRRISYRAPQTAVGARHAFTGVSEVSPADACVAICPAQVARLDSSVPIDASRIR